MKRQVIGIGTIGASLLLAMVFACLDMQGSLLVCLPLPAFLLGCKYEKAGRWRRGLFQASLLPCFGLLGYEIIVGVLYPVVMGRSDPSSSTLSSLFCLAMCCIGGLLVSMPSKTSFVAIAVLAVSVVLVAGKLSFYRISAAFAGGNFLNEEGVDASSGLLGVGVNQTVMLTIRNYGVLLIEVTKIEDSSVSYRWRCWKAVTQRETTGSGHATELQMGGFIYIATRNANNCIVADDVRIPWLPGDSTKIWLNCQSPLITARLMSDADFQRVELKQSHVLTANDKMK